LTHYAAFGHFIASYALAEAFLHTVARDFSGADDETARIIFGGMRGGDLADRVRKLTRSRRPKDYDEIDACLTQLEKIAKERHKLVHRHVVSGPSGLGLQVSNRLTVGSLLHAEEEIFELEKLEQMQWDCMCIAIRLLVLTDEENGRQGFEGAYQPWRYRPQSPKPKRKGRRGIPR
jgi:hypothetical protein